MQVKIFIKRKLKRLSQKKFNNIKSWILIIFLALTALGIYNFLLMPNIKLEGNRTVTINYQDKYIEKGYKAKFMGKDISKNVKVSGKANTKKIGTYFITYRVKVGNFSKKVTRKVIVRDKKKPLLAIDDADIYLCPGDDIIPAKVKATDEYDGDLSDKVEFEVTKNKITYKVKDKSGNLSEVSKKIIYQDIEKPSLKLKGSEYINLYLNENYLEPGYEVDDNCDDEIAKKVKKEGNVNTSKVGEYTITYSVTDKYSNTSEVTRKIRVIEKNKEGTIYLTFDDGPKSGTTDVILDILKEENVKATFFVTSRGPDGLIKRAFDEGHSIALHTASHDYSVVYSSIENYFNDLYSIMERVKRITGYESKIIRFPGGSSNTVSRKYSPGIMSALSTEVINRGFKYYDWNISSQDAESGTHSAIEIKDNVVSNLKKDRVNMVLMHDIKTYTRDALRDIIRYGKENGYTFDKITMDTDMVKQRINN